MNSLILHSKVMAKKKKINAKIRGSARFYFKFTNNVWLGLHPMSLKNINSLELNHAIY